MNEVNERNSEDSPMIKWVLIVWVVLLFVLGLKPVHLDEANFLMLTQGHWWTPHSIMVNWEGVQEPAFDVLSNPPGMAWWLWPMKDQSVWLMRLWTLPWSLLFLWGMSRLIQIFRLSSESIIIMAVSPFFALSHNSLMPEMPLLACIVCGWQGILSRKNLVAWSLILGFSSWFRYSGLSMIPLFIFWVLWHRPKYGIMSILACMLPTVLLIIHDVMAYGDWHFLHMISFQQEQQSWQSVVHKAAAFLAMLGGGFALPTRLFKNIPATRKIALVSFGVMGIFYWILQGFSIWSGFWIWFGGFLLFQALRIGYQRQNWWILLWILGGVVFLLNLRFAATRYWGPFVIPIFLLLCKDTGMSRGWMIGWAIISIHLVWDDAKLAQSQKVLALQVNDLCDVDLKYFSGHWGWQYSLEANGWQVVDEDSKIPNNVCYSYTYRSWPQSIENTCWKNPIDLIEEYKSISLPIRVHTTDGKSNYHSFMISNVPVISTYAPWGIGSDYWDRASLRTTCRF